MGKTISTIKNKNTNNGRFEPSIKVYSLKGQEVSHALMMYSVEITLLKQYKIAMMNYKSI